MLGTQGLYKGADLGVTKTQRGDAGAGSPPKVGKEVPTQFNSVR